jgi:Phosphotransferase enzyme family
MRSFHSAVADFVPPIDAVWRMGGQWEPGLIVGHNDAAPYNAVWRDGRLAGFFDWDMAGPVSPVWDVAYAAFSWVPLHARHVVAREGFTDFEDRPRRLRLFLAEYGWTGSLPAFVEVVTARIQAHVTSLRDLAPRDPLFARIVARRSRRPPERRSRTRALRLDSPRQMSAPRCARRREQPQFRRRQRQADRHWLALAGQSGTLGFPWP